MYLKELELCNFRCFENLKISFHPNLTVIVGGNGAGKTSILEGAAIAMGTMFTPLDGLCGSSINKSDAHLKAYFLGSAEDVQSQFPVKISAVGEVERQTQIEEAKTTQDTGKFCIEWTRTLNSENGNTTIKDAKKMTELAKEYQTRMRAGDRTLELPVIAYYGTSRLWDYHRERRTDTFKKNKRTNGYINSLDGTANIKLMMNWFEKKTIEKYQRQEQGKGTVPELEIVYQAMEECFGRITGYDNIKIQYGLGNKELDVYYIDEDNLQMHISLNQLSDGYKSTISLVADVAYRMAVLNPQMGENAIKETKGVVLIDEVDLHLHPIWQQRILKDLREIFPRVQFIVSTHAPEVISSVSQEHIRILRDMEIEPAPAETYGKDANGILKTVMDAKERPLEVMDCFAEFYEAMDRKKYEEAGKILENLEEKIGSNDPELTACQVQLDLEQV